MLKDEREGMGKKSKKHSKIKPKEDWIVWLINLNIGPYLNVLGAVEPKSCNELVRILIDMVKSRARTEEFEDPSDFINKMSQEIWSLWSTFAGTKLLTFYDEGCPNLHKQIIIDPYAGGKIPPIN